MADNLTCYKSRKFSFEYHEAKKHFQKISPNPSTFDPTSGFWECVYEMDNCLGDLFSMWEGLMEEVAEWLRKRGEAIGADESPGSRNKQAVAGLRKYDQAALADRLQRFFEDEVLRFRKARNQLTHQEIQLAVVSKPGVEVDWEFGNPAKGESFNLFRDALEHYRRLRALIIDVRRQLVLPLLEDRM